MTQEPLPDDATIAAIASGVLDTTWPFEKWSHAAHFAAALWLLRNPQVLENAGGMECVIRRYNRAVGVPETPARGFHKTITEASMAMAARELGRHPDATSLAEVLAALMASELGDPDWLLAHWSKPLLMSPQARAGWVAPDIAPLPGAGLPLHP